MIKTKETYYTTLEAAKVIGFHRDYVRRLILRGEIKADKVGNLWLIKEKDLNKVQRKRGPRRKGRE